MHVGGCVLSLAIHRTLGMNGRFMLLHLASRGPLPRVLPKRFMRMHMSRAPDILLHHPVSVRCCSGGTGRLNLLMRLMNGNAH